MGVAKARQKIANATMTTIFLVVSWEAIAIISRGIGFVSLREVLPATWQILLGGSFWSSMTLTVALTIAGLLAGSLIAAIVGIPLGINSYLGKSTRGTINFARAIPSVVLLPLLLASLGSRLSVVVILVLFGVSLKMVVYVVRGVQDFPRQLNDQNRLLRIPPLQRILFVRIPSASAIIASGIRQTVSRAYGSVILAGFLAGTPGLGRDINLANIRGDDATLLAYVVIAGLLAVFLYRLFSLLESAIVKWRVVA